MRVYLGLGSNLGDRAHNLKKALQALPDCIQVLRVSGLYETDPWGYEDQPAFLNQVVELETVLPPDELLQVLKELESNLGRKPNFRYGPRLIDLDILFYGAEIISLPKLEIPHPNLQERAFVLVPLAELIPDFLHPVLLRTVSQLLTAQGREGVHPYLQEEKMTAINRKLKFGERTYVMGILNITPDSFSNDGLFSRQDLFSAAVEQALGFVEAGVDILDIGGESTRPGAALVDETEEIRRIIPVIHSLREMNSEVIISVDTYKAGVARAALHAGADWINDVWGFKADPQIAAIAAQAGCQVILMHNRSKPVNVSVQENLGGRYVGMDYKDLIGDVCRELLESVSLALQAGVKDENIILDPGIGFGKTVSQNLELINHLDEICALGYPVLLGPSRKSFIGYTLDLPVDQRVEGTAAAVAIGIMRGASIVRVHDVSEMVRVVRMSDAILRSGRLKED